MKPVGAGTRQRRQQSTDAHERLFSRGRADPAIRTPYKLRVALSAALLAFAAHADAATPAESVLVIHSNQRPTPAAVIIEDTLRKVVPDTLQRPVEIYSEYLDIERFAVEAYAGVGSEFLRHKYNDRNIRVIVAAAPTAVQFAIKFRDSALRGVPIVHIAMPQDLVERMSLPPDVIGKTVNLDPVPTLELAFRLHPDAKRILFVLGAAERDRVWERRLRAAVARLEKPREVEYLVGLPTPDVLSRLTALDKETVVYTPGYFVDGAAKVATPRQSVELIGAASAAPVYGPLDTFLGTGIVGGYMAPYEEQAKQAGSIVVLLLNGTAPSAIAPMPIRNVPVVDARALKRWNIDEWLLPADTSVRFREPAAWERYWREISLGFGILLFQAVMIAALLIERRSRQRMASALDESQKQMNLAAGAARLSMFMWDVSGNQGSANAVRRRAGTPHGPPITLEKVLETAHPADREHLERAVRKAEATGDEFDVEYRVPVPDGSVRWVAARGRAEKGRRHQMLGVAVDVTERKLAELRAVEDRNALRHMTRVSMLGQLSASIAHQLNQPLAAILGNAEAARKMLARERVNIAELRDICDDIVADDNRAAEVIRRLGALYRRGDMKTEPFDLNELIRETLDLLRAELLIRHVTARTELAPSLPGVDGERIQLQQVLLNL
ncbi:MAG: PAS domain-containing protein, partial [Vicinamibacterales bacterium]